MTQGAYRFTAQVWRWTARTDGWYFVTLPEDVSDEIDQRSAGTPAGFGSVKVRVATGGSEWTTSVFPDKAAGAYVLPLKQAIRRAEDVHEGDAIAVTLHLV